MRKILFLALFLYNFFGISTRANFYDYEDDNNKRHVLLDERKNWRKKSLSKTPDVDGHKWESRRRREYDSTRYLEDNGGGITDAESNYRGQKHYDDNPSYTPNNAKSGEQPGRPFNGDKDGEKKMNCDRPHERYEPCFAGCASVTCDNPRDRMRPCYPFCEAGCVCIPPYVRDDRTHKCVVPEECTKSLQGIPDLGDESWSKQA